jgi:hypothetical protein
MITDSRIAWNRKRVFFAPAQMAGILADASLGAGVPALAEISATFEIVGMPLRDEDEIYHFYPIPWDMDIKQPLRFRVWFIHAATGADTPTFQVDYKGVAKQAAIVDVKASPDESVTLPAHTCSTTNNSLEVTAWAESTSDLFLTSTDFALQLALEITDLGSASNDEIKLMGLEMDYTIAAAPGSFRRITRSAVATPSGPNY